MPREELDLAGFLDTGPEEAVYSLMAAAAERRPESCQRDQEKVIGPCSPALEKAVREQAHRFDAVIATHLPHTTMVTACEAAGMAGVPCIALPLLHPRDRYEYWPRPLGLLRKVDRIDANSPTLARIMAALGSPTFAPGPGLYLAEFQQPVDTAAFREKYRIGNAPVLLWVGRKNARKGYPDAVEAVRLLQQRGVEVLLLMVGADDDGVPVSGRQALYLGSLPRRELLEAYACCSAFILPSRDESFGIALCEAWMAGKPVLGWERCSATRDLVVHGQNGFLCASVQELADAAQALLRDPALAERLGRKGRDMVMQNYLWERIAEQYEDEIVQMRKDGAGQG
jgi:glycosyltransferase involved in cell wall biosynthesis